MLEEDWQLVGSAPKRDMVIKEGGGIITRHMGITVYKLPGHTPGSPRSSSRSTTASSRTRRSSSADPASATVSRAEQFLASINGSRQFADIEVAVHVHSWLATYPYPGGGIFERAQALARRKPGEPHPFVDNAAWRQWLATAHAGTAEYIEDAKAGRTR